MLSSTGEIVAVLSCLHGVMWSVLYTMTVWTWRGIFILKNKYILLEMNQRN